MPKIFISYRRDDSIAITGRIYDRLIAAFEKDNVFQDVEDIPPGVDFRKFLQSQIAACDVVLVVIGRTWLTIQDNNGRRRVDNTADFVRIEVEAALKQEKIVIPVLVDNASSPPESDLPVVLQELSYRNASTVRHNPDFNGDINRPIEGIKLVTSVPLPEPAIKTRKGSVTPLQSYKANLLSGTDILPAPFAWVEIPAGKVKLVNTWDKDENTYLKKNQPHEFDVPAFSITKYPITNGQYQIFVDVPDGYANPKWWDYSSDAAVWRKANPKPLDRDFPADDHPRANVTWYEAVAFCRWLNARGNDESVGVTRTSSMQISLPTEQQWQRAAQGDTGWAYPWGNDWDASRCNNNVSPNDSNATTPVTTYEGKDKGDSPFGVSDMSGNVFEWCLTEYTTGSSELVGKNVRVLRGGSWWVDVTNDFRVETRNWGDPDNGNFIRGFRFVRLV